jgi:hypothetical protein
MSLQAPAFVTLNPSFIEPEILIQNSQPSGFIDVLAGGQLRTRLAEDDLLVYMKKMNLRTRIAAGQVGGFQELPGIDISMSYMSTATYLFKTRFEYDHHDVNAGARWGVGLPEAYRKGSLQANYQLARDACLYGMNPQWSEGIINAPDALAENLPPDSNGQDTARTYDNGEMAFYLANVIRQIKTRTYQIGMGRKFTILGPMRDLSLFEYNVVQLTQFQRIGAGTASTLETLRKIVAEGGDVINWCYDDTLIGKGDGGKDLVIVIMPEIQVPSADGINTNIFASTTPASAVNTTQYCDMAAPREITAPLPGGGTDVVTEWRLSSGWSPRSIATTLISMEY